MMYIGLGTLQTVYCILCKGAIILAMSAPIILINNNNSSKLFLDRQVSLYALHSDTLRQSQVWINEEGSVCENSGETEFRMWKRWNAHSSSSLSKNKAFRLSHGTFTRMNAVWECECHFWVMMPLPCWTFYLWILDALPVSSLRRVPSTLIFWVYLR